MVVLAGYESKKVFAIMIVIVILAAAALGTMAFYAFPSRAVTAVSTTSATSSNSTSAAVTSTSTISCECTTIDQRLYTGETVALDPSLQVGTFPSVLLTGNATQIAQRLASTLNELPVTLVSEEPPHGPNDTINAFQATYHYQTAKGSTMQITFLYEDSHYQFYEMDYRVKDYLNPTSGRSSSTNPSFNAAKADQTAKQIMSDLGISSTQVTLLDRTPADLTSTDYAVAWVQGYRGVHMAGTRVKDWAGSSIIEESVTSFDFYPPTGELKTMIIIGPYWYIIPPTFPLSVQPSDAISTAINVAKSELNMSRIYRTDAAFVSVQGHLYYYVSVEDGAIQYSMYVNPRTGEVGIPSSS